MRISFEIVSLHSHKGWTYLYLLTCSELILSYFLFPPFSSVTLHDVTKIPEFHRLKMSLYIQISTKQQPRCGYMIICVNLEHASMIYTSMQSWEIPGRWEFHGVSSVRMTRLNQRNTLPETAPCWRIVFLERLLPKEAVFQRFIPTSALYFCICGSCTEDMHFKPFLHGICDIVCSY